MSMDEIKFALISITTIVSIFSFILLLRSKRTSIRIGSCLKKINGEATALIKVTNFGEKPIVVSNVYFPIQVWCDEPRLQLPAHLKARRVLNDIIGSNLLTQHISNKVVAYDRDLSSALNEGESVIASIPLEKMMNLYFETNEAFFNSPFLNRLFFRFLTVNVVTSKGKCFKKKAMWEIRYYLSKKYGSDPRLCGKAP